MILVKYTNYANEFLEGDLYCNSLDFFWKNGFEGQSDIYEGLSANINLDSIKHIFPEEIRSHLIQDIGIQAVGYASCNVLCMTKIDAFPFYGKTIINMPSKMSEFGAQAIVITDFSEFMHRVEVGIRRLGFKYVCGDVVYHHPSENGKKTEHKSRITWKSMKAVTLEQLDNPAVLTIRDSFDKHSKYTNQNEWRISIFRGTDDASPFTLKIGNISDIAFSVRGDKLADRSYVEELIKRYNYSNPGYIGNVSRGALRNHFLKSGDKKYWFFFNV